MSKSTLNVLILAAGSNIAEPNSSPNAYPICVTEIDGIPLLERIVSSLSTVSPGDFHYCFLAEEVRRFHLDNLVQVLTPGAKIVNIQKGTKGSAATALMAIAAMDPESELLVVSANEWVKDNLTGFVREMRDRSLDAGTMIFHSVHPRYSYVRLDNFDLVTEAAQRNPISSHATTGVFWFKKTREVMSAIQSMIRKGAEVEGGFYVAPALNEMLLKQARIGVMRIDAKNYHPIKDELQLSRLNLVHSDTSS
ncbi:MAG: hypothetical protein ACK53K_04800 [Burkholderiales bacterium]